MNAEVIAPNKEADRRADAKAVTQLTYIADAGASPPSLKRELPHVQLELEKIAANSPSYRLSGLARVAMSILDQYGQSRIGWDDAYDALRPVARTMRKIVRSRGYPNQTYT